MSGAIVITLAYLCSMSNLGCARLVLLRVLVIVLTSLNHSAAQESRHTVVAIAIPATNGNYLQE